MTWTKLGDEFNDATEDLTDAEFRTHVQALVWSNWRKLELTIPKRHVRRFADSPDVEAAVDGLVVKGWWEDRGDAWWVGVHWPEWQEERSDVERRQAAGALRSRRWRKHRLGDHSLCVPGRCPQAVTSPDTSGDASRDVAVTRHDTRTRPDPSRPVRERDGSRSLTTENGSAAPQGERTAAFPDETTPSCEHGTPGGNLPNPLRDDKGMICPQCRSDAVWASSKPAPKGTDR